MVKAKRRRYTTEFKQEAVRLARESGRPAQHIALELGIPTTNLHEWLRATGDAKTERTSFAERDEVTHLRKEVQELKAERDFLKKAAAFFAKQSK